MNRKIREAIAVGTNYAGVFCRSVAVLWTAAPKETFYVTISFLLQGAIPAAGVWITKQVVDTVTAALTQGRQVDSTTGGMLIAAWIAALLVESLLTPWDSLAQGNLNEKLTAHINLLLMRKADSFLDLTRFEDSRFYDQLQLIKQEAAYQPSYLLQLISAGGRELFTTLAMFVLLFPLGWWVPLLILIATLPQSYVSLKLREKSWELAAGKSPQARRMEYCTSVMLTDTYAKEVRLFGLGNFLIDRYKGAFNELHGEMRRFRSKEARWSTSLALLSAGGNAIAFYWIVQQAFSGNLSPGNVLLFVQSLAYIQRGLFTLIAVTVNLYEVLLNMRRLLDFLATKPSLILSLNPKPVPTQMQLGIQFDNVSFCYPDGRDALANISFSLRPGETVALVGENGAGKTTIVKLLTRLYDPTAGNIWIDGTDLKDLDLIAWRRQIAVAFQDFGRYSFSLAENIALGNLPALADLEKIKKASQQAGLDKLCEELPQGYQTLLGKQFDGTELSGGQWQKLALARAFMRDNAQILILDEPTAALDPRSEYEIYRRFASLTQGKTTLLITHRLASVRMADRILVLKDGHLIEQGNHDELLRQGGEYALLWGMQAEQYGG